MITLEPQQVFRWRAHRHHLMERAPREAMLDVVTRVGGLQAQVMSAAELQLWARVRDITLQDIRDALWKDHTLLKTWAMRGTLHLLTASEFWLFVGALSTRSRHTSKAWLKYFGLTLEEMEAISEGVRLALDGRNLTREQLGITVAEIMAIPHLQGHFSSGWGSILKPSAFNGDLCFGPSQGQSVTFVRPDQWLGNSRHEDSAEAMKELARRYLGAYGPAQRDDFTRWFGMASAESRRIFGKLPDETEEVTVDGWKGWKGFALKKDVEAIQTFSAPMSVRLLPNFDPFVVARSHDAEFAVPDVSMNKERIYRVAGWVTPVVLVDGNIVGIWEYEKKRTGIDVKVEMLVPVSDEVREGIEHEAEGLGVFLGSKTELKVQDEVV